MIINSQKEENILKEAGEISVRLEKILKKVLLHLSLIILQESCAESIK